MNGLHVSKLEYGNSFDDLFQTKFLIITKNEQTDIINEIGKFFRKHNIMTYSSPDDNLNIDTLYEILAYAALYKSDENAVDERKATDITISIVTVEKPLELFNTLKDNGIETEMPYDGIYYIKNYMLFPTQIIVTDELSAEKYIWIKSLSNKMDIAGMKNLLDTSIALKGEYEKERAKLLIETVLNANADLINEIKENEKISRLLMQFSEETAKKYL